MSRFVLPDLKLLMKAKDKASVGMYRDKREVWEAMQGGSGPMHTPAVEFLPRRKLDHPLSKS